jgi:hypothetical protein
LIVFCSGQNEFLEDVTYGRQRQAAPLLGPVWLVAERLQVFRAAVQVLQSRRESVAAGRTGARPLLPTEVQTLLDQDGGLERYHRDDQHAAKVAEHYGSNVRRLAAMCQEHQVPLLVIQPPINLSDCPPFKSEFSAGTSASQRAEILAVLKQAIELSASDLPAAVQLAERVVSIDPLFARLVTNSARLLLGAGALGRSGASAAASGGRGRVPAANDKPSAADPERNGDGHRHPVSGCSGPHVSRVPGWDCRGAAAGRPCSPLVPGT